MSGNKVKIGPRVSEDVYANFVSFVVEKHGSKNGNLGRELEKAIKSWSSETDVDVMERRLASMEDRLDAMADSLSRFDRERENETSSASGGSYNARTERKVDAIEDQLPEGTDVDDSIVEHVIEENAGTARKTVKKYKKLLRNRGIAFPDPVGQANVGDLDPDAWVVGEGKFAMRLEAMDEFTPRDVDAIVGFYDQYLGDDWYLDAVPDDWLESNETKLERVDDDAKNRVQEYRRVHGLLDQNDHGRTFQ